MHSTFRTLDDSLVEPTFPSTGDLPAEVREALHHPSFTHIPVVHLSAPIMANMRTVVLPLSPPANLLCALLDVRSAVNRMVPDWRAHPEDSRFGATKRWYPIIRESYAHLASSWSVVMANEVSATLNSWDRLLRRTRNHEPAKFERIRGLVPRRTRLKASLPVSLYRMRNGVLDITIRPDDHVQFDLRGVKNPLFGEYLEASGGVFGLPIADRALVFDFRLPGQPEVAAESAEVDQSMPSADYATWDGCSGSVDLRRIIAIQGAMDRKRRRVQRAIPTDLKGQRRILRR